MKCTNPINTIPVAGICAWHIVGWLFPKFIISQTVSEILFFASIDIGRPGLHVYYAIGVLLGFVSIIAGTYFLRHDGKTSIIAVFNLSAGVSYFGLIIWTLLFPAEFCVSYYTGKRYRIGEEWVEQIWRPPYGDFDGRMSRIGYQCRRRKDWPYGAYLFGGADLDESRVGFY